MDVDVSLALATPPRPVQGGRRSPPGTTETAAGAWRLLLVDTSQLLRESVSAPVFDLTLTLLDFHSVVCSFYNRLHTLVPLFT